MENEKECTGCEEVKLLSEFSNKKTASDGKHSRCKECTRQYTRNHYRENKEYYINKNERLKDRNKKFMEKVKSFSECCRCGEDHPACLEFHHVDPSNKKHNVSEMIGNTSSIESIKEEIRKCEIICANCHKKYHYYN